MQTRNVMVRCLVRGVVQGVGFRMFVADHARRLGVAGWVRNRQDGRSVEIEATGSEPALRRLLSNVRVGPAGSLVEDVEEEWREPDQTFETFEIRR
jgi:acylphosphatase